MWNLRKLKQLLFDDLIESSKNQNTEGGQQP